MESTLTTHDKIVDVRDFLIPELDITWEHDYTESGDTITYYYNKQEEIDLGEHLIRFHLRVDSINYGKNDAWVGELELWGEEDIIDITELEKDILREKIIKTFES
nr:hypothetical protein [uncultured Allomuricauda sp.]